ncbi:SulP family inorganic anion transporter [Paludibacterium paludis]|nr:SulP family inorganic anion transporter [Paludibacterium paludis]
MTGYRRHWWWGDVTAAVVVTLLLVPQSLAYAAVAGLPAGIGLTASVVPLVIYPFTGKSHAQSVGPMAVTSLMVLATLSKFATPHGADYVALAALLALLSGAMLVLMGMLRFGFLADLVSGPVMAAFLAASAGLIIVSQLAALAGLPGGGTALPSLLAHLWRVRGALDPAAAGFGLVSLALFAGLRRVVAPSLLSAGVSERMAQAAGRAVPCLVILAGMAVCRYLLPGLPRVGEVPSGVPELALPWSVLGRVPDLVVPAFFIAIVNYVQSLSVAQWLAQRRGDTVDPDRELLAIGLCNLGAGAFGAFPVTGGLTRSVVNESAGAQTQLASLMTAALMLSVMLFAGRALAWLPLPALAATIIVSVSGMLTFAPLVRAWRTDRADAAAWAATFGLVLLLGVDAGIIAGVVVSLASWLWRSRQPHMAEVGRVPGTEHFRNVLRYDVERLPGVRMLRVDESLYFGNQRVVRERILERAGGDGGIRFLVLVMSGVNRVDASALAMLSDLDGALAERGVTLYLAEVKGPVGDVLERGGLLAGFSGRIFLSAHAAWRFLSMPADFQI